MEADEDILIDRARGADEDALRELLRLHGPGLRKVLAGRIPRRLSSLLSEEDILQETYTEVYLGIAGFVPSGSGAFGAWLRRLARNNLTDAIRLLDAEKRGGGKAPLSLAREESLESLYDQVLTGSGSTPSKHAMRNETLDLMQKAISGLPQVYRDVVQLYDLEHRSIAEVSEHLGRSQGATYLLRNRAHRRLAEILGS